VMRADAEVGDFSYFACDCSGPVLSMAHDGEQLFVGDDFGSVLAYDAVTGVLENLFVLPARPNAMIVHGARDLIIALDDQTIRRVDKVTGEIRSTRSAPTQVHAMVFDRGFFYVAGADGAVYRAGSLGGAFEYFTCFCFQNVRSLTMDGEQLIAADEFGLVGRIDLDTGFIESAFFFSGGLNSLVVQADDVLVAQDAGVIQRADADTGPNGPGSYYQSPIDVDAMLLIPNTDPIPPVSLGDPPRGGRKKR